jgi:DnaJ like chaperone protein
MALRGVFFGALLGLLITRTVWGAVLGALIGYMVEQAIFAGGAAPSPRPASADSVRAEFFRATFEIMGHVAKADGRVSEAEIDAARRLMREFQLGPNDTAAAINCFRAGKSPDFDPVACIDRLRAMCGMRLDILRAFIELQLRAALAGNGLSPPARAILIRVAERLGFSGLEFAFMEAGVRARQARTGSSRTGPAPRNASLAECYAELEIDANTSDAEVKKAYRRQMSRHHPDKLVANGLPESMAQMAKEKTQRIQEAYEGIRAARGMR